jgi:hypothetical protein
MAWFPVVARYRADHRLIYGTPSGVQDVANKRPVILSAHTADQLNPVIREGSPPQEQQTPRNGLVFQFSIFNFQFSSTRTTLPQQAPH